MNWVDVKWVDGALLPGEQPLPVATGPVPFETMGAFAGRLPLWSRHLDRLHHALGRLRLAATPPPDLRRSLQALLERNGHRDGVLRLQVVPHAAGPSWIATSRARSGGDVVRLLPCLARRDPADAPADLKCEPRRFHGALLAEARAGGADDGIALWGDGTLLETAVANLWLLLGDTWCTPPPDGRVLPGICRALLLERAAAHGLPVAERACDLGDLHRAAALVVSNAVHGPRAAALVGGTVAQLDSRMRRLWTDAIND